MKCPVCGNLLTELFRCQILNRYSVAYYQCKKCRLLKTEDPYWLDEAYSVSIADLDVGLVARNIGLVPQVIYVIENYFDSDNIFLDYAGGYGLFVRMMRDAGFNFFRQDKYCQNIFAKYFNFEDGGINDKFELITAFEFLEHVVDPLEELSSLLTRTDSIILSTKLQPENISSVDDWWYFTPETGQHITFYTKQTFEYLAASIGVNYYTDMKNIHLLTRRKFNSFNFLPETESCSLFGRIVKAILASFSSEVPIKSRQSLIMPDYKFIKNSTTSKY